MKTYLKVSVLVGGLILAAPFRVMASCGTVEVSKGDVKVTSGATHATAKAPVGSKICSGDTIIAGADSRAKLKMEDGNELNISPDSKIVIENYQYNPTANKKKVLLNVLQGKVRATTKQENMYNDKDKDGQANTFEVRTKTAVAGVRGTDFLTSYNPKSQASEVITFRGKVSFGLIGANGAVTSAVSVVAGQKLELNVGQPAAAPVVIPPKELDKTNTDTKSDSGSASTGAGAGAGAAKNAAGTSSGASSGASSGSSNSSGSTAANSSDSSSSGKSATSGGSGTGSAAGASAGATSGASASTGTVATGTSASGDTSTRAPSSIGSSTTAVTPAAAISTGTTATAAPNVTTPAVTTPSVTAPTLAVPAVTNNLPVVPVVPSVPTIPKCDICTNAQQTNKTANVNITIKIK